MRNSVDIRAITRTFCPRYSLYIFQGTTVPSSSFISLCLCSLSSLSLSLLSLSSPILREAHASSPLHIHGKVFGLNLFFIYLALDVIPLILTCLNFFFRLNLWILILIWLLCLSTRVMEQICDFFGC